MCALAVIERAVWSKVECDRMVCSAGKAGIIPLYWAGVANFTKTNIYPMPHASTHQQHSDAFNPTISHWTTRSASLFWPSFQKKNIYFILCKCFDRESFNNIIFMPAPRTADCYQRSWVTIFELVQYLLQVTSEPNSAILFLCSINNMMQSQQRARILLFNCINKVQL